MKRIVLLVITIAFSLHAETFNVSTTAELKTSLLTASANNDVNNTINLAAGTYRTTDNGGSFNVQDVALIGSTTGNTILDGNNTYTVITGSNSRLENLTVTNGNNVGTYNRASGIVGNSFTIINCKIIHNHDGDGTYGAGIHSSDSIILNSFFYDNTGSYYGAHIYGHNLVVMNSIFIDGGSKVVWDDGASGNAVDGIIKNNIFINSNFYQQYEGGTVLNNIILNSSKIENLFIDFDNENYQPKIGSALINAGTLDTNGTTLPDVDMLGNARVIGGSIDIGAYEFDTRPPIINSLTYTGVKKELNQLTFSVDYNLTAGRTISNVSYDYTNSESWSSVDTHTFDTAGTYTVKVKVTDDTGEFSIRSVSITIAPLDFSDMTDEQKIKKAVDSQYYNDIIAIINSKKNSSHASGVTVGENNVVLDPALYNLVPQTAYNTALADMNITATTASIATGEIIGQNMVISSPSSYGLVLISDLNSSVSEALTSGKQYVQDNLGAFGLVTKSNIELIASNISALSTGWTLVSTPFAITDMSMFESASVVWVYNNATALWSAYSSSAATRQKIADNASVSLLTTIPAGSGIWIQK